jgi:hypothetical protein
MKSFVNGLGLWLAVLMLCAAPAVATAEGPNVIQVVVVQVDQGHQAAYLERVKEVKAILERLGLPGFRVWQSTLSGPNTGSVIVAIESPDMTAFAQNQAKLVADPAWQKWVDDLTKWGKSRVTSNSLAMEITP